MATVRMKLGDKYADVFDSPETIKQAQLEGYTLVEATESEPVKEKAVEVNTETVEAKPQVRTKR